MVDDLADTTVPTVTFPNIGRYAAAGYSFQTLPLEPLVPRPIEVLLNLKLLFGQRSEKGKPARLLTEVIDNLPQHYENGLFFHDVPFSFDHQSGLITGINSFLHPPSGYVPAEFIFYHNDDLKRPQADGTDLELNILKGSVRGIMPVVVLTGPCGHRLSQEPSEDQYASAFRTLADTFTVYNLEIVEPMKELLKTLEKRVL